MRDAEADLKATSEAIQDDAGQLKELEAQKSALDPADPRVVELSRRIEALVAPLPAKAHAVLELSEEILVT